ncbi:MAG TPA: hypothetical protein VHJ76_04930, partial [Actinomycetota bacterium]|nr:hypothetical protein [Actinomycetota bacterium]
APPARARHQAGVRARRPHDRRREGSDVVILAHGNEVGFGTFGTDWLYLGVPVLALAAIVAWLYATGTTARGGFVERTALRIGSSLERVSGLPSWAAGGFGVATWALVVAVIGFLWDVAWHIDFGRDEFLFTPSHTMILVGLGAIIAAAAVSVLLATVSRADVGWSWRSLRIPYGAAALGVLGLGAITGFPLDELWHANYGIDVTMWGPTHLLMISGASFTPLGMWLLLREAAPQARDPRFVRGLQLLLAGVVVVGLSTFQAEFDFGVPQFQQLYHPVLIAVATGVGLVIARTTLGPGGAIVGALGFLAVRGALVVLLGPVFNETVARPPLYLGIAVAVEVGALVARKASPLARALVTGALVGTAGLATEWGWTQLFGRHPWNANLFPGIVVAALVAVAAAVLGTAMGRILAAERPGIGRVPLALAAAAILAGLTLPLPRHSAPYRATVEMEPAGNGAVDVAVTVDPARAAEDVDYFEVLSWQGGSLVVTDLVRRGPGVYESASAVPASHHWKTMVRLTDKDVMVAVPIYLPEDPAIGAEEIPVVPERTATFHRDTELLMREAHEGAAWPATVAYTSILAVAVVWIVTLTMGFVRLGSSGGPAAPARRARRLTSPVAT